MKCTHKLIKQKFGYYIRENSIISLLKHVLPEGKNKYKGICL